MEFLSQTYTALRGPQGTTQTPSDAIQKLNGRLSQSAQLPDRRAAVMSLKGLARDCRKEIGETCMPGLIEILLNDADMDADIAKASLECFSILCSTEGEDEHEDPVKLGMKHSDYFLTNEIGTHRLLQLLALSSEVPENFYTPFCTLQFLSILLANRRSVVQTYFISAPDGCGTAGLLWALGDRREILRNEALSILTSLLPSSLPIQKIMAFSGAFDGLLSVIEVEGGIEGGVVVQDALSVLNILLRGNLSNQTYFAESHLPILLNLLTFPPTLTLQSEYATPQEFALQFWNDPKTKVVKDIVGILGLFVEKGEKEKSGGEGIGSAIQRCLVEIALASNAPPALKTLGLQTLPSSPSSTLATLVLTPYAPVPNSNGEEWDKLEHTSCLSGLVSIVLEGEYGLESRTVEGMQLRAAAACVFENFVRRGDVREAVLRGMSPESDGHPPRASLDILTSITSPPPQPMDPQFSTKTHFASVILAALIQNTSEAKASARNVLVGGEKGPGGEGHVRGNSTAGQFFVPADGLTGVAEEGDDPTKGSGLGDDDEDDDDEAVSLMGILVEYLSLSFLVRSKLDANMLQSGSGEATGEAREWDKLITGYLLLIIKWLWDDGESVAIFLEARGVDVLVEPINQPYGTDPFVKGLCAFLLGICYEFCPISIENEAVSRSSIHQIIHRLGGSESIVNAMAAVRTDDRFRDLTPENVVTALPVVSSSSPVEENANKSPRRRRVEVDGEVWVDWSFVEFWKTNYYTIQRCVGMDPESMTRSKTSANNQENGAMVTSLKNKISNQDKDLQDLRAQLSTLSTRHEHERETLQESVSRLSSELATAQEKQKEVEKEHEDLLVYLDEMSAKRKAEKARLRELGEEVSEDEEDAEDDDGEEE